MKQKSYSQRSLQKKLMRITQIACLFQVMMGTTSPEGLQERRGWGVQSQRRDEGHMSLSRSMKYLSSFRVRNGSSFQLAQPHNFGKVTWACWPLHWKVRGSDEGL